MSAYTEILGLDPETVQTLADTYAGYALSRERQETTDHTRVWTASSWLIGALFQCLNAPAAAKPMFAHAARHYAALDMPIWRVCNICAGNYDDQISERQASPDYQTSEELFYQVLQVEFGDYSEKFFMDGKQRLYSKELSGTIPNLNMPYELIVSALRDLNYAQATRSYRFIESIGLVVRRMNEITNLYRADDYWARMEGQFIPFEPVSLAISIVMVKKMQKHASDINSLIKNLKLRRTEDYLMRIAYELLTEELTNE